MKWVITGGCGFIGSALTKFLLDKDEEHQVRIFDNLSVGSLSSLESVDYSIIDAHNVPDWNEKTQVFVGNILDAENAVKMAEGADVIVHLAANTGVAPSVENPRMDCNNNVIGIFNFLEAARVNSVKRFVFASSGAPVGECIPPIHEEMVPHPVSPYGASKLAGEAYCSAYYRTFGVETVALRFGNIYGIGSAHKSSVVAKFITTMMRGENLTIYGDGSQTRDFIYLLDMVEAIYAAATVPGVGGEIFQIATSHETTVSEIADYLLKLGEIYHLPKVSIQYTEKRLGDVARNFSDTTKAKKMLSWQAKTSLADGLEKTIRWFAGK